MDFSYFRAAAGLRPCGGRAKSTAITGPWIVAS